MVNVSVAHEHTGLLKLGSDLTPKAHSALKLPAARPTPHRLANAQRTALFPLWPRTESYTGAFRGFTGVTVEGWGGRTHTLELFISVFNFLLHLPLAQPSLYSILFSSCPHIPLWDTWCSFLFWRLVFLYFLSALWSSHPRTSSQVNATSLVPKFATLGNSSLYQTAKEWEMRGSQS